MRTIKSQCRILMMAAMSFALPGCFGDTGPVYQKTNYAVSGLPDDAPLKQALDDFLDNRTRTIEKAEEEDAQERHEMYQERLLATDLTDKLHSLGYYDADVSYQDGAEPWTGRYEVDTGALYTIESVHIEPEAFTHFTDTLTVRPGDDLVAENVLRQQVELYQAAQKNQCYYKLDIDHAVMLDRTRKAATLGYRLDAGPQATFGAVIFTGQDTVKESYLRKLIPWKPGDCFRHDRIESLRTKLFESGLFSRADVVLPENPAADGSVALIVQLKERAHRSVSAGLSYYTDEGAGMTLGWAHRNFLGAAENFDAALKVSMQEQSLKTKLTKPFFIRKDQTLSLNAGIIREDTDAYLRTGVDVGAALNRKFTRHLTGSTGVALSLTRIEDHTTGSRDNFGLLSLPQTLTYDNRDDPLDARTGWWLQGTVKPFIDVIGEAPPFWKTELGARTYYTPAEFFTLALRAKYGSIVGPDTLDVPATERFYAGGGGSIRGYGYQEVGPMEDGDPTGGRSVAEFSTELRFRLTEKFGAVTFVDAGSVSENATPDFDNLAVGAGVGFRYFTDFGPLRFDVGVPLSERENTGSNFQVYISIGQAF